jgi:hypothetical protein
METQAGAKTPQTGTKFSLLDWPSPERLMAARRARAHALRDMTVDLCRRLRSLALPRWRGKRLSAPGSRTDGARPHPETSPATTFSRASILRGQP